MPDATTPAKEARKLLVEQSFGILSTLSRQVEGYPHGSLTPFCLDYEENPILLISDIAQHTRNIRSDPRVSLTVFDIREPDIQANPRLTVMADAVAVREEESEVRDRYVRYFPGSEANFQAHDFAFYRLSPVRCHYIGGFGKISWLESDELFYLNPFSVDEEEYIIRHMNEDHADVLRSFCNFYRNMTLPESASAVMVGVDGDGFDVLVDGRRVRISFRSQISDSEEAREQFVAMAKEAM